MKRVIFALLLCFFLLCASAGFAEEPILVIDPHGHSSQIKDVMFTPDGKTLISVSFDKTIRLWDVATGDLIKTLRHEIGTGHEGEIHSAALSPDGKFLAVGGFPADWDAGNPVYVFDLESGEIIGLIGDHQEDLVLTLDFSPDGKWLASGSAMFIRIWDMSNIGGDPAVILESESEVFDLAFAPDSKQLVSGHVDAAVRLWELPEDLRGFQNPSTSSGQALKGLKPKKVMKKHTSVACCVDFSPDGQYIASGDFDGNNFLWDAKKGNVKKKFEPMEGAAVIVFAPDSKSLLIGNGNKAEMYSVPKGKKQITFEGHVSPVLSSAFSNGVTAAAFYGNDLIATAGGNDYDIYIWDVKTGNVKTHIVGQGKRVEAVAFGENLQIAFGNTSIGLYEMGPLERSFDFGEMQLNQQTPVEENFTRTQTEYQGKTLQYTPGHKNPDNWYTLRIEGGGMIKNARNHGWVRAYTFTPNGDVVVGSSHVLKLYRSDGTLIHDFIGHNGEVWAVSVSKDGKLLVSASDDQTIKLWNLATGECLATLFVARDNEWVCWTPKGYYEASAGGEKHIGWQINQGKDTAAKYYPVSVFRKQFHYPELVKRTIATGELEQALAEIPVQEATVTQLLPPQVQWIIPQELMITTSQATIRIQAKIISDSDLTGLKVLVNGRAHATGRGLSLGTQQQPTIPLSNEIDQEITLSPGRNEIAIFAANQNAGAISDMRIVVYEAQELKPDLYMISIGISSYELSTLQLEFADDDAKAISRVFQAQQGKLYKSIMIKELYDRDATRKNILEALEWLGKSATQNDIVVIFVASHGVNEQGEYYLLPTDGRPDEVETTLVSWKNLSEYLGVLPARVLLLLDTCHSGQLGQDFVVLSKQVDNTEALRLLSSDEYGVVILAASTGREFSLEHPEWGHGAFTKALLEALEEGRADYSNDGIVNLRELDMYVADRVETLTNNQQHPTTQKPSTISRFSIVQVK